VNRARRRAATGAAAGVLGLACALGTSTSDAAGRLGASAATPTVTELTGGVTPGFSSDSNPDGITTGPDGHIWFTESSGPGGSRFQQVGPGGVGRVNDDGSVTELVGGATPGFTPKGGPEAITTGPDGRLWFAEYLDPGRLAAVIFITTGPDGHVWFTEYEGGRLARINDDGTVSEFAAGVTPGFSARAGPTGITSGPDGRIWFAECDRGGIGRITVGPAVATGEATGLETGSPTLHGTVRSNAQQTVFHFEYGPTSAYGSETPSVSAGAGTAAAAVSAELSGLKPSTLYHYRLAATNDTDTAVGVDRTFTTPARAGGASQVADTQAPSAPTSLRGRFTSGTLTLAWAPATDNVGVDHYRLFRDGRALGQEIPASARQAALRGFRTNRRTVLRVAALDAAGNQGRTSSLTVSLRSRPSGIPPRIPAWATRLLAFQTARKHGKRPATPVKLAAWYPRWKAWRLDPYRIVAGG
jgi:hypothetical protein